MKTIPGPGGVRYVVSTAKGDMLAVGDTVRSFRGEFATLLSVDAAAAPGKSAKVTTTHGTHYAEVYELHVSPAPDVDELATAALELARQLGSMYAAHDVARVLSCSEINAIARVLTAAGEPDAATGWITEHAQGDDEGDEHGPTGVEDYPEPLADPMDELQCDSCQ